MPSLITTKLHLPEPRSDLVPRSRLITRLTEAASRALTLVSASAGFGKTTLVSSWLSSLTPSLAPEARGRVGVGVWLSLDEDDNDPVRFFTYIVAALQTLNPALGGAASALLQSPQPPPLKTIIGELINDFGREAPSARPYTLTLDDYHLITSPAIHEALAFLLDHLPSNLHLILITRVDPPLPLARLRARGQLAELRADDLRFTPDEAADFLNRIMGLRLTAADVAALEGRTEGWIAGLQLAALSMQGLKDVHSFVSAFSGSHRYVIDYLAEEVLNRQPPEIREFLLQTSILDRLCGPLCDAVISSSQSPISNLQFSNSQSTLEHLEHSNLFLIPLDSSREWYRYHNLFAEVLRQHLRHTRRDLIPDLHRRASQWYEQHGLISDAIRHALAAPDLEVAVRLIEDHALLTIIGGQTMMAQGWINSLPELARQRPRIALNAAWAALGLGQVGDVERHLSFVEAALPKLPETEARPLQGEVAASRALLYGFFEEHPIAIASAQEALSLLPETHSQLRASVAASLAYAYFQAGRLNEADQVLNDPLAVFTTAERLIALHATLSGTRGMVRAAQGRLAEALRILQETAPTLEHNGRPLPIAATVMVYHQLAACLYERNELEAAEKYLRDCLDLSRLAGNSMMEAHSLASLGWLTQARGNFDEALRFIEQASELGRTLHLPLSFGVFTSFQIFIWVRQGNLAAASAWADDYARNLDPHALNPLDILRLELPRVRLAEERFDEALEALHQIQAEAAPAGHGRLFAWSLLLEAEARQARGDLNAALAALNQVLEIGEREGYLRMFLDEGEPMRALLEQVTGLYRPYARRLLLHFGPKPELALVEPLSDRELEVLQLIYSGLSNQEIAEKLVVAISTVKKHINSLYGKLGVQSRTQALARARELNLVD